MADRILTWFIPDYPYVVSLPRYYADADYEPVGLRVYADTAPSTGNVEIDIQADGVSLFKQITSTTFTTAGQRSTTPTWTPVLTNGNNDEESDKGFASINVAKGQWIKAVIHKTAGAKGISIHLELDRTGES